MVIFDLACESLDVKYDFCCGISDIRVGVLDRNHSRSKHFPNSQTTRALALSIVCNGGIKLDTERVYHLVEESQLG